MKLLADACIAGLLVRALRKSNFEVEWIADWERDPGDVAILEHARVSGQVLITRDKDFGTLIFRDGRAHAGVLRVTGEMTYAEQAGRVLEALGKHAETLGRGHLVTVEPNRIRISTRAATR